MTMQNKESRAGMAPVPENLDDYLTECQKAALVKLEQVGWFVAFVRRTRLIPPIVVVTSHAREKYGVLLDTGEVDFPLDLKLRPGDLCARGAA